jgi:hypothetical protein
LWRGQRGDFSKLWSGRWSSKLERWFDWVQFGRELRRGELDDRRSDIRWDHRWLDVRGRGD